MSVRVEVRGELLAWARERSRIDTEDLLHRFPKLPEWEGGETAPTLRQLEQFAQATHTAVGFLLLPEPPKEELPIPDFRTMGDVTLRRPSPDLLDTVYQCQQRQEWYQAFALANREDPIGLVGSLTVEAEVHAAAATMRDLLRFAVGQRGSGRDEALRRLAEQAETLGVLVMVSGVVGSNTRRRLDPNEFRGFALVDQLAPLVFVNGSDTKSAKVFTIVHELAHIWLGQSAISNPEPDVIPSNRVERWCNQVAAELLVPMDRLREEFDRSKDLTEELDRLAGIFNVSTLVVLRRIHEAGYLKGDAYHAAYRDELARVLAFIDERAPGGGGNFYNTQPVRSSKRFTRALITSTLEGQTLYRDAFQLLGFKKLATFRELGRRLGVT